MKNVIAERLFLIVLIMALISYLTVLSIITHSEYQSNKHHDSDNLTYQIDRLQTDLDRIASEIEELNKLLEE